MPLPAGSGDGDYLTALDEVVLPIVEQYEPQALLVSAGMDIHSSDPLGGMLVSDDGFAAMTLRLLRLAQAQLRGAPGLHPGGRLRPPRHGRWGRGRAARRA